MELVFVLHLTSTFFMTGIIWFVQLVHYPLLGDVSKYRIAAYEQTHMRLATWVVAPPMVIELVTGVLLIWHPVTQMPVGFAWVGLGLLLIIWIATAIFQAPTHQTLAESYDEYAFHKLVASNWIRTIAWNLRSGTMVYVMLT